VSERPGQTPTKELVFMLVADEGSFYTVAFDDETQQYMEFKIRMPVHEWLRELANQYEFATEETFKGVH